MGQSSPVPSFSQGNQESINLLEMTLKKLQKGVIDRVDLKTLWPASLRNFVCCPPSEAEVIRLVAVSQDGDVKVGKTLAELGKDKKHGQVFRFRLGTDSINSHGKNAPMRVRVYEKDSDFELLKRCTSMEQISDVICEALTLGGDELYVTVCREILEIDFDKNQVVDDYSTIKGKKVPAADQSNVQVAVAFLWAIVHEYHLKAYEPCAFYYNKMNRKIGIEGEKSRDTVKKLLVSEMRSQGVDPIEVDRFIERTGGQEGAKTAKYMRLNAMISRDRYFYINRCYTLCESPEDEQDVADEEGLCLPVPEATVKITEAITKDVADLQKWTVLLGWDPERCESFEEFMHLATRAKMTHNDSALSQIVLSAIDLLNKFGQRNPVSNVKVMERMNLTKSQEGTDKRSAAPQNNQGNKKKLDIPKIHDAHLEMLVSVTKGMIDKLVVGYESGEVHVERFYERFERLCDKMISLVDRVIIPLAIAEGKIELAILGLRNKADYMRYLCIFVPHRRDVLEEESRNFYEEAIELSSFLRPRAPVSISAWANYAVFLAEVKRDHKAAAHCCIRAIEEGSRDGEKAVLSSSGLFNWQLLNSNAEAFDCMLVLVLITFDRSSLDMHRHVERKVEEQDAPQSAREEDWSVCVGMRNCSGFRQAPKLVDRPESVRGDPEYYYEAVKKWLQSRPGSSLAYPSEDDETIVHVRWVEHVEEYSVDELGLNIEVPPTSSPTYLAAAVIHEELDGTGDEDEGGSTPRSDNKSDGEGQLTWHERLTQEMLQAPGGGDIKQVNTSEKTRQLLDALDDDGVIRNTIHLTTCSLYPGDTLVLRGDMTLENVHSDIKHWDRLEFVPRPQVEYVRVLCDHCFGMYVDFHQQFVGFRQGENLNTAGDFKSLHVLGKKFAKRQEKSFSQKPKPRRLRGLSARRDPLQAARSGCA